MASVTSSGMAGVAEMTTLANSIDIADLGERAETMIEALGVISSEPTRLVRRFLSPEHRRAADLVAAWMREARLDVTEDALGTVRGHFAGASTKRLLIGSHIDTVVDAGRYDGIFGVVAGILAAGHLARSGKPLPFSIDVLAFGDEEGSRFPTTLASSAAAAGIFDLARLGQAACDGITSQTPSAPMGRSAKKWRLRRTSPARLRPMWRSTSSRGRYWKPANSRLASSLRSPGKLILPSSLLVKQAMPVPCRCGCAAMRSQARPRWCCSASGLRANTG